MTEEIKKLPKRKDDLIHVGGRKRYASSDIILFESKINYTTIYLKNDEPVVTATTLGIIYTRLPEDKFVKLSRSQVVNVKSIAKIDFDKVIQVHLDNGMVFTVARRKRKEFSDRFKKKKK